MSLPTHPESPSGIRDNARTLVERARSHQDDLEALVATADRAVLDAEAELSHALDLASSSVDHLRRMLRSQLQRNVDGAHAARQLLSGAREQHRAAARLLSDVDAARRVEEQRLPVPRRNAVLVVDDCDDVRELVSLVLQNAGFVVRTAANGLEGLIAAHELRPSVIVMDVTMPVLDGVEATRLIKAAHATQHARVIAFTGNPTLDRTLIDKFFAAVLRKPATPDVVVATVRQVASL